ncbi:hypothetical protein B0H14DRAFT_2785341, partial [Mycena olivaceomarginata]
MAKLSLDMANLKLKWSMRLPPDKWKPHIKRGSGVCSDIDFMSLTALLELADGFPPLKSAVGGVLVLWNTVECVKTSKEKAKALSWHAYKVLKALTDTVPDLSNISPSMLMSIQHFDSVLIEACNVMAPLTKRRRLLSLNHDEATLELFNRHLDESFQTFT